MVSQDRCMHSRSYDIGLLGIRDGARACTRVDTVPNLACSREAPVTFQTMPAWHEHHPVCKSQMQVQGSKNAPECPLIGFLYQ